MSKEEIDRPATAVVFGAAGGIGGACARALMASGRYELLLTVDLAPFKDSDEHLTADMFLAADRDRVIDRLLNWDGRIAALVYGVGIDEPVDCNRDAWPKWQRILDVDFTAAAHILCSANDRLLADATAVVLIDSTSADTGSSIAPPYGAAKAACRNLARSLACRTGTTGARYNSLAPGPTETSLGARLAAQLGGTQQMFADRTIAKRLGQPDEIAAGVEFLCSPRASFVNGTVLVIDGGFLAG